jgi:DNA-binding response OmpR family regulator
MNRVLVVDDEAGMRAALEAHFLRRDWRVDTAASVGGHRHPHARRGRLQRDA